MPKHDKDLLKESLTVNDIENLLYELGAQNIIHNEEKQELITNTICHNDSDGSHKLFYYYDSEPVFRCYTECSCNMDIYELVRKNYALRNIELTFSDTVNWVAERSGKSFGFSFGVDIDDKPKRNEELDWLNRFTRKKIEYPELKTYSDRILNVFEDFHHPSFLEDNITHEAMNEFDIKFNSRTNSIIIPHRGVDGRLLGIRNRNLNEWEVKSGYKYLPSKIQGHTYSFPTYCSLYGLHNNFGNIKKLRKVAIFESEKSVLQCAGYFPENNFSVALSGRNMSQFQVDMLLDLGVEEVILCLDKMYEEVDSRKAEIDIKHILKLGRRLSPYVRVYTVFDTEGLIPYTESPSDMGKDVLIELMKNKQEILNIE